MLTMLVGSAFVAVGGTTATRAEETPQPLRELPPLLRAVSDEPGVLSLAEGQALAKTLTDIERETGVTIIVAILTTTRPESIDIYVQRLINHWLRESKRLDHGRFVFVTVAKEDRELRIVPSKPLGWALKQLMRGEVAERVPALLKQDKYFEALTAIAEELSRLFAGHDVVVLEVTETRRSGVGNGAIHQVLREITPDHLRESTAHLVCQAQRDGSG